MSVERRLAAIEETLTPTELVVAWLEEVHAFGSLEAAVRSMLAPTEPVAPLDELVRAAVQGARSRATGRPAEERNKVIDGAVKETVFRFKLALRIITKTYEQLDRQALLDAACAAQLAFLTNADTAKVQRDLGVDLVALRDLIVSRVDALLAAGEARRIVEERYLAGHTALFPDREAEWTERLAMSMGIGALAVGICERDGVLPPAAPEPEVEAARIGQCVADLVEPARVEALEDLGQGRRAFGIAAGWVRGKLGRDMAAEKQLAADVGQAVANVGDE